MAKKNKTAKSTTNSTVNKRRNARSEMHEFMRNQPVLYFIFAIAAFVVGNYLFDLIARLF